MQARIAINMNQIYAQRDLHEIHCRKEDMKPTNNLILHIIFTKLLEGKKHKTCWKTLKEANTEHKNKEPYGTKVIQSTWDQNQLVWLSNSYPVQSFHFDCERNCTNYKFVDILKDTTSQPVHFSKTKKTADARSKTTTQNLPEQNNNKAWNLDK